jgi:hypothetical protein
MKKPTLRKFGYDALPWLLALAECAHQGRQYSIWRG